MTWLTCREHASRELPHVLDYLREVGEAEIGQLGRIGWRGRREWLLSPRGRAGGSADRGPLRRHPRPSRGMGDEFGAKAAGGTGLPLPPGRKWDPFGFIAQFPELRAEPNG